MNFMSCTSQFVQILTRGMRCTTNNCKTRLHWHCFATYRRRFSVCPSCNQDWPREVKELTPVGEDAVKDGADGKRQMRTNGDASNEEQDSEDEDALSQTQTQKQNTRSKTQKRGEEAMDMSQEEDEDNAPRVTQSRRTAKH